MLLSGPKRALFVRNAVERLMSDALGREIEHYDEAAIRTIMFELEENDDRFQTLPEGVVTALPFQYKVNSVAKSTEEMVRSP